MFESDDYDEVLSQLDFKEVDDTQKRILSPQDTQNLGINKNIAPALKNDFIKEVHVNPCLFDNNLSPKHTKRRLIDSHFDHKNKRKFPGPAGLLTGTLEETKDDAICQIELLSQDIDASQNYLNKGIFETPLWKRLLEDTSDFSCNTIKVIKQQALTGNLRRRKAEIVRGFIESIDRSAIDPLITLRDTTGHIKCTLHRDTWLHFSPYFISEYCALVLHKPTVLTTGSAFKKHYLNVTIKNISHIYSNTVVNETEELPDGFVKIVNEELTLIKHEKQYTGFDFSPSNEINEADILGDLEGEFSDIF
ncbi:homologous recombination OB-fold protein-like [Pieris brassicae]|uniref:Homologous recombination OB-fold protein OB-fold domain-containing protein n=1 Tax=Pieris brassicae TaxID=7116 RepID=A0A9P0THI7_PIEBR|nr:homologous recombination OB-fold protein-like [Pieris brassicae]CAH4030031.1 unnamed protein product [Pieris brassicae]